MNCRKTWKSAFMRRRVILMLMVSVSPISSWNKRAQWNKCFYYQRKGNQIKTRQQCGFFSNKIQGRVLPPVNPPHGLIDDRLRTQSCNLHRWAQLQHIIRKIRNRLHAFVEKNVTEFICKIAISITIIRKNDKIIDWPSNGESARIDQHAKTGKAAPRSPLFTFLQGSR